ncbi:anti-repressor SinI family protein [Guptibacillus hwajinpoensis]
MFIIKTTKSVSDYVQWIRLMKQAKEIGLSIEEVRRFLNQDK